MKLHLLTLMLIIPILAKSQTDTCIIECIEAYLPGGGYTQESYTIIDNKAYYYQRIVSVWRRKKSARKARRPKKEKMIAVMNILNNWETINHLYIDSTSLNIGTADWLWLRKEGLIKKDSILIDLTRYEKTFDKQYSPPSDTISSGDSLLLRPEDIIRIKPMQIGGTWLHLKYKIGNKQVFNLSLAASDFPFYKEDLRKLFVLFQIQGKYKLFRKINFEKYIGPQDMGPVIKSYIHKLKEAHW